MVAHRCHVQKKISFLLFHIQNHFNMLNLIQFNSVYSFKLDFICITFEKLNRIDLIFRM